MVVHSLQSKSSLLAMAAFALLERSFKGDLVTPGHPDYDSAIKRWAANATRRAKIVAFVSCPQDISLAIKYARETGTPLAIRGGGHNPSGSSSVEDGIVIDLSRHLNGCRIDAENKLAYVGGGALWETVDKEAIKYGLASVGGTVNHTGVGGLTLGGGYGWLSGQHGLVIDNLVQATMITADGSVLTASNSENNDLFWAIRGGGCNFGICCEFVFRLHPQQTICYSGPMIFPEKLVDQVIDVTAKWQKENHNPKCSLLQVVTRTPPEYAPCIVVIPFFNGSVEEGRQEFKDFLDLGPIDLTGAVPYENQNALQNASVYHGQNIYMRGVTQLRYTPSITRKIYDEMVARSSLDGNFRVSVLFELFPLEKINEISNDAMAFNLRGPASNVMCLVAWEGECGEAENEKGRRTAREMTDIISDAEQIPEISKMRAYGNYVGDEKLETDRAQKVFGNNYPRLQQIKAKYDPDVLFSKWFAIIPSPQST